MAKTNHPLTYLQLIARVDQWPYFSQDPDAYRRHIRDYYYFMIYPYSKPFGYMHHSFVEQMPWPDYWVKDDAKRTVMLMQGNTFDARSALMDHTLRQGLKSNKVNELTYWADEQLDVVDNTGKPVLKMDVCGGDGLGIVTFAVHMIGYIVKPGSGPEEWKYWVPRRSRNKMSYPGMLDNTVGGTLRAGEDPKDCIVREAQEEISLDPEYTRSRLIECGTIEYEMDRTDRGGPGFQHQVQYLFELPMDEKTVPSVGDREVEEILLAMSLEEVQRALREGQFKLNCAMTWIAFFIRYGMLTEDNESDFAEINARLHRRRVLLIVD